MFAISSSWLTVGVLLLLFLFENGTFAASAAPLSIGEGRSIDSSVEPPPADISGIDDPQLEVKIRIRTDNFVWVARDSSVKSIDIVFEDNGRRRDPFRFENVSLILSNIKCYNQPLNTPTIDYPPCVRINIRGGGGRLNTSTTPYGKDEMKEVNRITLFNSRIEARYLRSNGTLFSATFENVIFEKTIFDVYGAEPVVARYDKAFRSAPVNFKFAGSNNKLVDFGNVFTIRDMAGQLYAKDLPSQMILFESEGPLDNLRLNIYNIFNVNPKASSRHEGNSPLGVEVIVPSSRHAALSFSFFSDVLLFIAGNDRLEPPLPADPDNSKASLFSENSYILITNFKTVFPYPNSPIRYGESNVIVNAHFDASTLYIDKCDFKRGGGGITIGSVVDKNNKNNDNGAVFSNNAHLNITEVESSYTSTTGGTVINIWASFKAQSHGLVRKCTNATVVRFHNLALVYRSSLEILDSGMITLDFTSISFGKTSLRDASFLQVADTSIASAFLRNVDTTGGHIQLRRNARSSYTHHAFDAEVNLINVTGSGVVSDIEGDLHPSVTFRDFTGVYELWSNTFFNSQIEPIKIIFEHNNDNNNKAAGSTTAVPKRLTFSWNEAAILLVDDFTNHPQRRTALLPVVSFGCATVSTFDSVTESATIISPNPTPCGKLDTIERCVDRYWFYKSVGRREYVMIEDPETCLEDQTDIPS